MRYLSQKHGWQIPLALVSITHHHRQRLARKGYVVCPRCGPRPDIRLVDTRPRIEGFDYPPFTRVWKANIYHCPKCGYIFSHSTEELWQ